MTQASLPDEFGPEHLRLSEKDQMREESYGPVPGEPADSREVELEDVADLAEEGEDSVVSIRLAGYDVAYDRLFGEGDMEEAF